MSDMPKPAKAKDAPTDFSISVMDDHYSLIGRAPLTRQPAPAPVKTMIRAKALTKR